MWWGGRDSGEQGAEFHPPKAFVLSPERGSRHQGLNKWAGCQLCDKLCEPVVPTLLWALEREYGVRLFLPSCLRHSLTFSSLSKLCANPQSPQNRRSSAAVLADGPQPLTMMGSLTGTWFSFLPTDQETEDQRARTFPVISSGSFEPRQSNSRCPAPQTSGLISHLSLSLSLSFSTPFAPAAVPMNSELGCQPQATLAVCGFYFSP